MIEKMGNYKDKEEEKMSEESEDLKEELSQAAAEPLAHSPEQEAEKKINLYSQNRPTNTTDLVLQKIANIKNR